MSNPTLPIRNSPIAIKWTGLLGALLVILALYLPTLGYYWVGEDFDWAVRKDWAEVLNFFNLASGVNFYRPLSWSSFALDAQLWGNNPLLWRAKNLVLNLICVALVWLLAMLLGWPNSQFDDTASVAIIIGFVAISLILSRWAGALAWFGLAWVVITLLPVFGIAVIAQDARYVYLPSVGLALMLAAALGKSVQALTTARAAQPHPRSGAKPPLPRC